MNILISAGPTIEDIDPVRFISNRATGKLGTELAAAALKEGHRVTLVHGPVPESVQKAIAKLNGVNAVAVRSAGEMRDAMLVHQAAADVIIMNAAVADFAPVKVAANKLKKAGAPREIKLRPTPDILKELGKRKSEHQILIGFALETGEGKTPKEREQSRIAEAARKLKSKNLDAIVLDTPDAMGADKAHFIIMDREQPHDAGVMTKRAFAKLLIALVTPCGGCSGGGCGSGGGECGSGGCGDGACGSGGHDHGHDHGHSHGGEPCSGH